jgi:hypothetical protein
VQPVAAYIAQPFEHLPAYRGRVVRRGGVPAWPVGAGQRHQQQGGREVTGGADPEGGRGRQREHHARQRRAEETLRDQPGTLQPAVGAFQVVGVADDHRHHRRDRVVVDGLAGVEQRHHRVQQPQAGLAGGGGHGQHGDRGGAHPTGQDRELAPVVAIHQHPDGYVQDQPRCVAQRGDHRDRERVTGQPDREQRDRDAAETVAEISRGRGCPQPTEAGADPVPPCHHRSFSSRVPVTAPDPSAMRRICSLPAED